MIEIEEKKEVQEKEEIKKRKIEILEMKKKLKIRIHYRDLLCRVITLRIKSFQMIQGRKIKPNKLQNDQL